MGSGVSSQGQRASAGKLAYPPSPYFEQTDDHSGSPNRPSSKSTSPKMSIVAWVGLGTASIALIALIAGLVLRLERRSFVNLQQTYGMVISLQEVLSDLEDAEARECGYLLTGESSYLEAPNSSRKILDKEFDLLRDLAKYKPKELHQVERLRYLVHQKLDELQAIIDRRKTAGLEAARAMALTGRGKQLTDAIRQNIIGMEEEEQSTLALFSREWQSRLRTGLAALVGRPPVLKSTLIRV